MHDHWFWVGKIREIQLAKISIKIGVKRTRWKPHTNTALPWKRKWSSYRTCGIPILNKIIPNTHRTFELCQCIFVSVTLITAIESSDIGADIGSRAATNIATSADGSVGATIDAVFDLFGWAGRIVTATTAAAITAATIRVMCRGTAAAVMMMLLLLLMNNSTRSSFNGGWLCATIAAATTFIQRFMRIESKTSRIIGMRWHDRWKMIEICAIDWKFFQLIN